MTEETGDPTEDLDARYRVVGKPPMRRAEVRVIGSDYGATSYTTKEQADHLAGLLGLESGMLLLDVGSGAGWPGIYLAHSTGCRVVLTDLPLEGLRAAARRVDEEGVQGRVVATTGDALALRDGVFDAATSSDVFCWLANKLSVLRAKRRILKPGGHLAFFVIAVADDLTPAERHRAIDAGPDHVAARDGYPEMLDAAGFDDVEFWDVTAEYRITLEAWIREWEAEAAGIIGLVGAGEFEERQGRRHRASAAVDDGLLQRWLISARR